MLLTTASPRRETLQRLAIAFALSTIAWNVIEGIVAISSGAAANSVALIGFGLDSFVEVFAAAVVLWRMTANHPSSEFAERRAVFLIGLSFALLATYVALQSAHTLITQGEPSASVVGIVLATVSLVVMPSLAIAKREVASRMSSSSLNAEATQTFVCSALSLFLLVGLGLNAIWGIWWADPVAAAAMVPLIAREARACFIKKDVCC